MTGVRGAANDSKKGCSEASGMPPARKKRRGKEWRQEGQDRGPSSVREEQNCFGSFLVNNQIAGAPT